MNSPENTVRCHLDGNLIDFAKNPEEQVPQSIIKRLLECGYSKKRIVKEYTVQMGSSKKFCDIGVVDRDGTALRKQAKNLVDFQAKRAYV